MSRRHHHAPPTAQQKPGRKAQERERRIQAARQRSRIQKFVAMISILVDKWRKEEALQDDIASLPANERRFYKMQLAKCDKSINKVVCLTFTEKPRPGSPLMQDTSKTLLHLLQTVCTVKTMPEICMHMDVHSVVTYLVYTALQEWHTMEHDTPDSIAAREEVQHMITQLRIFCDHAIKADSPLIPALNEAFCATRDILHNGAPLPHYDNLPEVVVA